MKETRHFRFLSKCVNQVNFLELRKYFTMTFSHYLIVISTIAEEERATYILN